MSRFAKLAIAAAIATFVLIVVGGLVRATDSGLGCPDWPLCFGDWVPPAELHAWIEHSHRLVAAVAVGPLVGAVALITVFSRRRRDRPLLVAAVAPACWSSCRRSSAARSSCRACGASWSPPTWPWR